MDVVKPLIKKKPLLSERYDENKRSFTDELKVKYYADLLELLLWMGCVLFLLLWAIEVLTPLIVIVIRAAAVVVAVIRLIPVLGTKKMYIGLRILKVN